MSGFDSGRDKKEKEKKKETDLLSEGIVTVRTRSSDDVPVKRTLSDFVLGSGLFCGWIMTGHGSMGMLQ